MTRPYAGAVKDPWTQTSAEPLQFERQYVTDADYPKRLSKAFVSLALSKPRAWMSLALTVLVAILIVVEGATFHGANSDGGLLATDFLIAVILVVLSTLALAFGVWRTYARNRRRFAASIPTGSLIAIGFRDETVASRGPQGHGEVNYSVYQSVDRRGDFVFLRQRGMRSYGALPAELFTPESLAWLRSKVTK